ncbi:hypothetical protein R3P38DRAFT_2546483 [Favolaschia claudopus]|uniref:Uncharacterized protein n=1 Tax=Favolaschia claudopus TaxID=2862362 RepID=A0AAW0AJ69_9AGAR
MPKAGAAPKRTRGTNVRMPVQTVNAAGAKVTKMKSMSAKARAALQEVTNQEILDHLHGATRLSKLFDRLRELSATAPDSTEEVYTYDDVAQGRAPINLSHEGGEMDNLREGIAANVRLKCGRKKYVDRRNRRDRTQKHVLAFRSQLKAMTTAYMKWATTQEGFGAEVASDTVTMEGVEGWLKVKVVDIFSEFLKPCCPGSRLWRIFMEMYLRLIHQSYSRRLLMSTWRFKEWVKRVLGRGAADWRMKNCCPACTYKLEGEMKLVFQMLLTMDGNDSLKRVLRKDKGVNENGESTRGECERPDPRAEDAGGTYFLRRDEVDKWAKEVLATLVKKPKGSTKEEESECQERWKNMSEELTAKMWGVFDETGVFLALCRHGFVILIADMVKSGELAKYGLAVTNAILEAFGPDLGIGYDIGCGFCITIRNSPLGEKAKALNLKTLVGAFHGHAHNRLCQLKYLATYVNGLGLEDLEGCERFFSKSNSLSRAVRYASVFHRRQSIATYLAHTDTFDTYANLSTFLINNYKQALELLGLEPSLKFAMQQAGIPNKDVFKERLRMEDEYLRKLIKEPEEETDQMEYYRRITVLEEKRKRKNQVCARDSPAKPVVRRHAWEGYLRAIRACEELEVKMDIERWWTGQEEYIKAGELVATRDYRLAVNKLEELVVKRLFELTKMNMSGTGYKLRKHIAKALQTRSKTIRRALERYNKAAKALVPPRRQLEWDEVIDYAFLSYFDILRDPEANAIIRPWATPAARQMMDTYFKIERAKEEIERLNVEIRRLVTYIKDEREFLLKKVAELQETDPQLAFFVERYRMERGRFDGVHMERLQAFAKQYGRRFTGTLRPGVRMKEESGGQGNEEVQEDSDVEIVSDDEGDWETDEEDEEEMEERVSEVVERIMAFATDKEAVSDDE